MLRRVRNCRFIIIIIIIIIIVYKTFTKRLQNVKQGDSRLLFRVVHG